MDFLKYIVVLFSFSVVAQTNDTLQDPKSDKYIIVEGDSVPKQAIDLETVIILHKLQFNSKEERARYLILRRRTLKVYPYAKLAATRLDTLTNRLAKLTKNSEKRRYTRLIQKYIEGEFSEELKKLSRSEGRILVKLIHRQTGITTFDLIKELRSGWRAFWYNTTASMFDISLKSEFNPNIEKEDYLIEDILQRSFQNGRLERQKSAIEFDFFELTNKWLKPKRNNP
ncbi:DUF4294 domain-containing protein [Oceanihabitans sp. IOP_32]|uniref:DUF4294 domain-containing protein n=1 Tax=Oceanihabitans sp. IOP_32 TaxID=2529032 RepID=UPI0012933473|nr:DUF4294 domain-containing protein [Oceanihabitans sp. IOP_32]QFZ53485.1 DUF4294 domain-containing protein [Oceanihabitans sp. IOP_32]